MSALFEILFWFRYPDGRITCVDVNEDGGAERMIELTRMMKPGGHVIAHATVGAFEVSTVFLNQDHYGPWLDPRAHPYHPIVFETMVFANGDVTTTRRRYRTEAEAIIGHAEIVSLLERGEEPE